MADADVTSGATVTYDQGVRGADLMKKQLIWLRQILDTSSFNSFFYRVKSEIEGSELFVNSFVQDPVQVETDEFVPIGIGHGKLVTAFH